MKCYRPDIIKKIKLIINQVFFKTAFLYIVYSKIHNFNNYELCILKIVKQLI